VSDKSGKEEMRLLGMAKAVFSGFVENSLFLRYGSRGNDSLRVDVVLGLGYCTCVLPVVTGCKEQSYLEGRLDVIAKNTEMDFVGCTYYYPSIIQLIFSIFSVQILIDNKFYKVSRLRTKIGGKFLD
jgi:hypothetical protein